MCDMYCIEDISHITMQCPAYQEARKAMFGEISRNCRNAEEIFNQKTSGKLINREIIVLFKVNIYALP